MDILKKSYLIILGILISIIILYFKTSDSELKSFSLNLITEILGIFITVFLIDRAIQSREKKEKLKILQSAYIQFRNPVMKMLDFLITAYKASCDTKPEDLKFTYKQILSTDEFYEAIKFLDFKNKAPITPTTNWSAYSAQHVRFLKDSFDKTIDKYAFVLDSKLINDMESLSNSRFLQILASAEIILQSDISMNHNRANLNILANNHATKELKTFLKNIFELIEYFEKQSQKLSFWTYDQGIWGDNIAPKIGSSRVKINAT
ncbi:hypothetical protein [Flavobacterium sp.]|uniref:hypothetical protein n=1 Tax=Flavobacterium sp. TaxID=239 RepID=UPI00262B546A|nr:hypothetical protein [Flavobacterium sp.]